MPEAVLRSRFPELRSGMSEHEIQTQQLKCQLTNLTTPYIRNDIQLPQQFDHSMASKVIELQIRPRGIEVWFRT